MNKKIHRLGVIGCGALARQAHLPNILAMPEAELAVCCDVDEQSLEECARIAPRARLEKDFQTVAADPEVDVLVVATTERFRVPIFEAAAAAGKPVYTEKPVADTWENATRIRDVMCEAGLPVCVGHNRRCSPAMVEARRIFQQHRNQPAPCPWRFERPGWEKINVGDADGVPMISIRVNDDWRSWKAVHMEGPNAAHGLVLAEMTHFADIACWFLESEPVEVFCMGRDVLNHSVSIVFSRGELATISMSANGSFGYPKELHEFMFNAAYLAVDHMLEIRTGGIAGEPPVRKFPYLTDNYPEVGKEGGLHGWLAKKAHACAEAARTGDPMLQFAVEPDRGHLRMLREFLKEIEGAREPVSPADDALRAASVCLAAIRSMHEKRPVAISEITGQTAS